MEETMQRYRHYAFIGFCLSALFFATGCASSSGSSYTRSEARTSQSVRTGTVIRVDKAVIEEDPSLIGPAVGGVAGGAVGSTIGRGKGRVLGTVGGALVGAGAGALVEKQVRTESALEIVVKLDDGKTVSVVQADDERFYEGDRVRVLYGAGGKARVRHN